MVENKEYSPTLVEWDELVLLWNRSRTVFASTLATNTKARIAWTTKNFIEKNSNTSYRAVFAWLERNLETTKTQSVSEHLPATNQHDEITAVYRTPRTILHGRITTTTDQAVSDPDTHPTFSVASRKGIRR